MTLLSFYVFYGKEDTDYFFQILPQFYKNITKEMVLKFIHYHNDLVIRELKEGFNLSLGGLWERWKELPEDEQEYYVRFIPNKRIKRN